MNEKKNSERSAFFAKWFGAKMNQCYGNSLDVLRIVAKQRPEGWYYVEGIVAAMGKTGHQGWHHGWVVFGNELIDITKPYAELQYRELRKWPAVEFLAIAEQDVELPLTD